jgi:hypothetical protein
MNEPVINTADSGNLATATAMRLTPAIPVCSKNSNLLKHYSLRLAG